MLGAVIYNGNNTLVVELPTGIWDLQLKLRSVGVSIPPDRVLISDEDGNQLRVKLYASSPEEAHLLSLLTPEKTLADANTSMMLLSQAEAAFQPRLKCGLLSDAYRTLDDFISAAKGLFSEEPALQAASADPEANNEAVLQEYEQNPNIRVLVSCIHDGQKELFPLPMTDPKLSTVFVKLDEYGEGNYSLDIEQVRYKDHWPEIFGEILREEGLFAVNALAAAFPPLEDYDKFCAVAEYADAYDSRALIALADHLDDFDFYPGCNDSDDVAREWLSQNSHLQLSAELEEYFDFDAYGSDHQDDYHGQFVSGGYVFMQGMTQVEDILSEVQHMEPQ